MRNANRMKGSGREWTRAEKKKEKKKGIGVRKRGVGSELETIGKGERERRNARRERTKEVRRERAIDKKSHHGQCARRATPSFIDCIVACGLPWRTYVSRR